MPLTDAAYWDGYWQQTALPSRVDYGMSTALDLLLAGLDDALQVSPGDTVLELGGAPGAYLSHFAARGASLALVDYSAVGCRLARENLDLLGLDGQVLEADIFAAPQLRADRVYSLGVIEHFQDLVGTVIAHARHVTPGGRLVLGFPNFSGIYRRPLAWQRPEMIATTVPKIMNLRNWSHVPAASGLEEIERRYVCGLSPEIFAVLERRTILRRLLAICARALAWLLGLPGVARLRRINGRLISGYALVAYLVPEDWQPPVAGDRTVDG